MEKPLTIGAYNDAQAPVSRAICNRLRELIDAGLPTAASKLWHGGPVWFIDGNPVAGYWVRKAHVTLLFWSGRSFEEGALLPEGKFAAAEARFRDVDDIDAGDVARWLEKAATIQWDYKNIIKRGGRLEKIGDW